jgi:hypothetical protein
MRIYYVFSNGPSATTCVTETKNCSRLQTVGDSRSWMQRVWCIIRDTCPFRLYQYVLGASKTRGAEKHIFSNCSNEFYTVCMGFPPLYQRFKDLRYVLLNTLGLCIMSRGFGSTFRTCLWFGLMHSNISNTLHWLTRSFRSFLHSWYWVQNLDRYSDFSRLTKL